VARDHSIEVEDDSHTATISAVRIGDRRFETFPLASGHFVSECGEEVVEYLRELLTV